MSTTRNVKCEKIVFHRPFVHLQLKAFTRTVFNLATSSSLLLLLCNTWFRSRGNIFLEKRREIRILIAT